MAKGKPIGTIFAELDLDTTRYTKAQQRLLRDATSTSLSIEDNFRKLGIKSSAEFDLMRAKIENSYRMIRNSALATTNDIVRAEKAKNAQIARLDEMQYGRKFAHIEMLKKNWLAAAAVIGSAMYAAGRAWDMAKLGAEYSEQRGILDNLARKYDLTADSIVRAMERASDGLIARADLMKIALGGLSKGLKPEQLIELADAARILGDAAGKTAREALTDLTEALETGRARGLKNYLGTALDLETAFGELVGKMTEAEKAQAMYSITMMEATRLQAQQTGEVDRSADSLERLEAKYQNLMNTISVAMKSIVVGLLTSESWMQGALAMSGLEMPEMPPSAGPSADEKRKMDESIRRYQDQIDALKKIIAARADAAKSAKKTTEDMTKIEEQAYLKEMALFDEIEKENARHLEEMRKENEKYEEALYLSEMERFDRLEKENADYLEQMKKTAIERFRMERDIYEDLRGYEKSYYDAALRLINEQAKRYREAGVDEVAVAVWVRQEIVKENIRKGKSSEDFVKGWAAGLEEMRRDALTWGKAGYDVFKTFAEESRGTVSDVLFDGIKGKTKDFEDYWYDFADALLRKFTDICAQMLVEWLTTQAAMKAAGSGLGWLSGILGFSSSPSSSPLPLDEFSSPYAKGGVFDRGSLVRFAAGGVIDRPTIFPMTNGMGLMGERGPEAIMPLKRLPGGRLGVEAAPAQQSLTVSVGPIMVDKKNNRMASELRDEIEDTVQRVIRRYS
jgi:lambda family phage tail tape measure protein